MVLIKLFFVLLLLYWVARTVVNLGRSMLGHPRPAPRVAPPAPRPPGRGPSPEHAPSARGPVEDAKWVDL